MKRILLVIILMLGMVSSGWAGNLYGPNSGNGNGITYCSGAPSNNQYLQYQTSGTCYQGATPSGSLPTEADGKIIYGSGGNWIAASTVSLGPITLPVGTATAGTAPIYFQSGTNLTTCADGAEEYDGTSRTHCVGTARKIYLTNDLSNISAASAVTGILLTGYSSGAGTVGTGDTILQAFNKLNGNQLLNAPIDSPSFTTKVTVPGAVECPKYASSGTTDQGTKNINIDGVSYCSYLYSPLAGTAATYTPVITAAPASGYVKTIKLTIGGGTNGSTITWTNVDAVGTALGTTVTATKYSHYVCEIPTSGHALCGIVAENSTN